MMTRKNYVALANAIAMSCDKAEKSRDSGVLDNVEYQFALVMAQEIAHSIGNVLAAENPNFDWARWMNACDTGA